MNAGWCRAATHSTNCSGVCRRKSSDGRMMSTWSALTTFAGRSAASPWSISGCVVRAQDGKGVWIERHRDDATTRSDGLSRCVNQLHMPQVHTVEIAYRDGRRLGHGAFTIAVEGGSAKWCSGRVQRALRCMHGPDITSTMRAQDIAADDTQSGDLKAVVDELAGGSEDRRGGGAVVLPADAANVLSGHRPCDAGRHAAIIAAKASGRPLELTLKGEDNSQWTFVRAR